MAIVIDDTNIMQMQVCEFMDKMRQHKQINPGMPPTDVKSLRYQLINEESQECCKAILANDLPQIVDALCDLLYVTLGTAEAYGIDIQKYFDEVHRTNMLKDPDCINEFGKVIKPAGWQPPRIAQMLEEEGYKNEY